MTISIEYSTVIDCPIEDVFDYVSTPNKDIEWKPRVVGDPEVNGAMDGGTTWTMPYDGLVGTVNLVDTCIAYDSPTRFGYEPENGAPRRPNQNHRSTIHVHQDDRWH